MGIIRFVMISSWLKGQDIFFTRWMTICNMSRVIKATAQRNLAEHILIVTNVTLHWFFLRYWYLKVPANGFVYYFSINLKHILDAKPMNAIKFSNKLLFHIENNVFCKNNNFQGLEFYFQCLNCHVLVLSFHLIPKNPILPNLNLLCNF